MSTKPTQRRTREVPSLSKVSRTVRGAEHTLLSRTEVAIVSDLHL